MNVWQHNKLSSSRLGGMAKSEKHTAVKYGNNIIVIDAGLTFPAMRMLGIDMVIPDYSYLLKTDLIGARVVLNTRHEDHTRSTAVPVEGHECADLRHPADIGLLNGKSKSID
jgi:ribonuclease J